MRLSNCNCGNRIDCGCVPYFDSFVNDTVSILSVGNLVSDTCVFDEYVIDWFRDGEHAMVSGKGYDPDIEAFHPFLGDESIPVIGGQWKPVLRYVVISGVKMYPTIKKCQNWCPDLDVELPSVEVPYITVTNIECGLKNLPGGNYDYQIKYSTSQDFAEATRTIRMYLSPDGSTGYLAFYFSAVYVADQVEFYYNEETTPLMQYIVGSNLTGTNINSTPEEIDITYIASVVNLEDRVYSQGDYITIKVLPSVKEPGNPNTIWTLNLKCLPKGIFECNEFNSDMSTIDVNSIGVIYNEIDCRYEFTWNMKAALPYEHQHTNFSKYNAFVLSASQQLSIGISHEVARMAYLNAKIEGRGYSAFLSSVTELSGFVSYSKIGSNVTFQFDTASDYAYWKNGYQNLLNHTYFANYSTDPTDPNHYKFVNVNWRETMSLCGDNFTQRYLTFHLSSPVSFNDGSMTITIQMLNVANGIVQAPCDTTYERAQQYINNTSNSIAQADFSGTTHCQSTYPFNGSYVRSIPSFETYREFRYTRNFYAPSLNSVCDLPLFTMTTTAFYGFFFFYIKISITDQNDPINNFRIESRLNSSTGQLNESWTIIYEKSGGTVIIP